jgi:hydroxycarboxylate dehydrogenase B
MSRRADFVGLLFANVHFGRQIVAPFGGSDARLHTNPICIAVPSLNAEAPFVLDFATSRIALGKTRVAFNKQAPVAEGSLIDASGAPTTDPGVMFAAPFGALLPFGEYKGSGLAVVCELIAGAMLGGLRNDAKDPPSQGLVNNLLAIVIDPARFGDPGQFRASVAAVLDHVKQSPPADAERPVLFAGEPERAMRAARQRDGIPIDSRTWAEIVAAGRALGIATPI